MQIDYKGEHSITFYDYRNANMTSTPPDIPVYNTWSSWFLIPTTAPYFKPYEPKLNIVSIPGSNGVVDLSEAVVGKVLGDRRVGEWEFIMDIERAIKSNTINVNSPWDLYYKIISDIDRKWVVCVLLDSPGHIFTGRITVTGFTVESGYGKIKLSYNVGGRNTAWLSTGKIVGVQDVAWFIKENISDNWTPETFDDQGNGMIDENLDHLISEDQFQIEWTVPDGPMYEIEVDDDGTLIQEDTVPVISYEDEIVFDDEAEWDPETSPFQMYTVRYLNDDGSVLGEPESIIFGTVINPSTDYQGTPVSQVESTAQFVGWSESDGLIINSDTDIYARYDYDLIYYKVRFYNDDDSYLAEIFVRPGETAVYPSQTLPISAIHGSSFSIFKEWSKKLENVLSDMDVTAVYETVVRVRFYNDDGNPILVNGNYVDAIVPYGTSVTYPYEDDPVSTYVEKYENITSTFVGWDKNLTDLTPSIVDLSNGFYIVTAIYEYNGLFKVNFNVIQATEDGLRLIEKYKSLEVSPNQSIYRQNYMDGAVVYSADSAPHCPYYYTGTSYRYEFIGWSLNYNSNTIVEPANEYLSINGNREYYAVYDISPIEKTWSDIFASEDDGSYVSKYHVGDRMILNNSYGDPTWTMIIVAINGDTLSNSNGTAKITWLVYSTTNKFSLFWNSYTKYNWKDCNLRNYLNNEFLETIIDKSVSDKIKLVDKTYYDKNSNSTKTSQDKIWIPSTREIAVNSEDRYETSGVIYNTGYSRKHLYPLKFTSSSPLYTRDYFLRSSSKNDVTKAVYTGTEGNAFIDSSASDPRGLVFGFCT